MEDIPQGVVLIIKVIPKAGKTEIVGFEGQVLRVRLNAVPDKGKANAELIAFLAKALHIGKTAITIVRGETARIKTIRIEGVTSHDILKIIET